MSDFAKKLRDRRDDLGLSQSKLAKAVGVHHSIIGRYERDEAKPTIDVIIAIAKALNTTVSYLLGENADADLFKDPVMLQRLSDLDKMESNDKSHILHVLDGFIKSVKLKNIAAL